jgi:hypothetical protein
MDHFYKMLPHHRMVHNDVLLLIFMNVTYLGSRGGCKLPDDGRRPKYVGAILI